MNNMLLSLFAVLAIFLAMSGNARAESDGPCATSDLDLQAPIARWDEALPLGNGLLGGLLWGEDRVLKLSLDRGDLWDLRRPDIVKQPDWNYATIKRLVDEKNQKEISRLFDDPYNDIAYPTKLPVGRLEITLPKRQKISHFSLRLANATGEATLSEGKVQSFFSAMQPVAMLRIPAVGVECSFVPGSAVEKLGYSPAKMTRDADYLVSLQEAVDGLRYAVVFKMREVEGVTEIALTITSSADDADPVALGKKRVDDAFAKGFDAVLAEHCSWWKEFWAQSSVRVPDPLIQRQYDLVEYFYGAASRRGAPPMPLQGVWTADEGILPPWKGDYHHDLNTQLTYWAYLQAGHFDEGLSFLDFMWNLLPEHREFARTFYGTPGAAIPGVMTLDGKALGGWSQYSLAPTNGAWVAQSFYWHWRYTMDDSFLKDRAYPYLTALAECFEALLKPDANGKLVLPLSSSPEIHDNTIKAWLKPNTNFDLALLRWHFGALIEMGGAMGDTTAVEHWKGLLAQLDDFATDPETGALRLTADESLTESHRHHSQLMAIHPLGLITAEGGARDQRIIDGSLAQVAQLGTRNWCGYSFSWLSCMAARTGKSDLALQNLDTFVKAFISRNGFHLNGDQLGGKNSNFTYRPFTLEGNFAAAQAVHEMLLQSWNGVLRVFPAVPDAWRDVAFNRMRAEGAFEVSGIRRDGHTESVEVLANRDGQLRLRNPFGADAVEWNRADLKEDGGNLACTLRQGEKLVGKRKQ